MPKLPDATSEPACEVSEDEDELDVLELSRILVVAIALEGVAVVDPTVVAPMIIIEGGKVS